VYNAAEYERWQALFRRWLDEQQSHVAGRNTSPARADRDEQVGLRRTPRRDPAGAALLEKDDARCPSRSVDLMLRLLRESLDTGSVGVPRFLLAVAAAQGVRIGKVSLPEKEPAEAGVSRRSGVRCCAPEGLSFAAAE